VVTNPDGVSVTLKDGFTYRSAILELNKSEGSPRETLLVTSSGPYSSDFTPPDITGVYAINDPNNSSLWETTTGDGGRFSQEFKAPTRPGVYEVRYYMRGLYLLARVSLTVR
jgi:hypothetical protein